MLGFFGVGESVKAYAEESEVIDFDNYGVKKDIHVEGKMVCKLTPKKTGIYDVFLHHETWIFLRRVYGTVYNSDMEEIGIIVDDYNNSYSSDSENPFYFCSGKTYYVVVEVNNQFSSADVQLILSFKDDKAVKKDSEVKVVVGSDERPVSKANIKGLTYDEKTHTLEINNYNGSDEIKIISPYYYEADKKDDPNYPNINIKISGVNNFLYDKSVAYFLYFNGCGNYNIIGDGTVNIKFKEFNESDFAYNEDGDIIARPHCGVIKGHICNITYDGPTIVVEKASMTIIDISYNDEISSGKLIIKSGDIIVNSYTTLNDYLDNAWFGYGSVFIVGALDMSGGTIYVNYDKSHYGIIFNTMTVDGKVEVTGGKIIITGFEDVLNFLNEWGTIYSFSASFDEANKKILLGDSFDISELDVKLEKDVYEYDGKEKTPKVRVAGFKEGKDYTVSYSNNVNIGTAKVTVKGIGRLTGSKEATFKIVEGKDDRGSADGVDGPKVGSKITDGKLIYKVTKVGSFDGKTVGKVPVVGIKKKSLKKVTIKSVIKVDVVKYKVTAIGKKAFKKGKKLKSIVIGKNVSKIGKEAFAGCKKLKSIKIKSKKIKKFVKGTFKGVKKTCVIKVPKAKKKVYAKKIKKAGFTGIVK